MENKFCVSCGQQLNAGAKFCPHCGASQPDEVTPNNAQNTINTQPTPQQPVQPQQPQQPVQPQQPQQPVQPQAPQQPNVQGQYQQQVPPTGQTNAQYQQQPGMQYQQMPQQPGMQERVKKDLNRFKNQVPGQAGPQPELGFVDSVKYCLANAFDFLTPESRKSVFWWNYLGASLIMIVAIFLMIIPILGWLAYAAIQAGLWFSIYAAGVRRIRYIGKSPWWILLPFYRVYLLIIDKPQPYMGQVMYQQPNQMQQPYQQQNYQQPQQPVQPQEPQQPNNNDQNPPQN